jgi:hypothetical protein
MLLITLASAQDTAQCITQFTKSTVTTKVKWRLVRVHNDLKKIFINLINYNNNPWRNNPWGSRPTERPPPVSEASANFVG